MILYDSNNCKIEISDNDFITSGGEGFIYKVGNQIAKIYKNYEPQNVKKIKALLAKNIQIEGVCFPTTMLYDSKGNYRGYLMPKARGKELQFSVFGYSKLRRHFPDWTRIDLCSLLLKILKTIDSLHQKDFLLGDINPMNIMVASSEEVYFLDTDSYQFDNFPCPVGEVRFVAPEIQGITFKDKLRKKEHEYYAIATLIFMVLFLGKSPYAKIGGGSPGKNIGDGDFSYPLGNASTYKAPKGPWEYIWKELPYEIKKTFYLTFVDTKKLYRFSPEQWVRQIKNYKRHLLKVTDSKKTIFPKVMEKLKDDVSTGMRRDVKPNDPKLSKIQTILNPLTQEKKIGVLELSTKAVKLLIGKDSVLKNNRFDFDFFPVRLGVRTNTGDLLNGKNVMDIQKFKNQVLPVIKSHIKLAKKEQVGKLFTVATAAYRACDNRKDIIELIKKETNVNVKILSKREEARATLVAFTFTKPKNINILPEHTIMIDQGGGSTEVTSFNKKTILNTYSINLGTTTISNILFSQTNPDTSLNDAFLHTDKITKDKLKYYLKNYAPRYDQETLCFGVGTAITKGTGKRTGRHQHGQHFTQNSLARRIYYYEHLLNKKYKNVEQMHQGMINEETLINGLDTRNVLSIRLGLPLYLEIMRKLNLEEITVSATSLWYGIYFDNLFK